ncbi:MAG TPA: GNAT family N-acetyltransferase [Nitrososphaeraceae archaeon]|nr:GNAT family N-acetyltransferase [Nitrososphaeraceae archaeon]
MESNESTFCSLWSRHIKVNNCADLFINEKFSEDYFFNKVNDITCCSDISCVLKECAKIFLERELKCYVYIDYDWDAMVENLLLDNKFTLLDTMQAFRSDTIKIDHENPSIYVNKINVSLLPVWINIFCDSFNVLEWKPEVERILKEHFNELTLLIAYVKSNSDRIPAGCALLLNRYETTGLYCLGTLPSFRDQGLARKLIKVSLDIARRQSNGFLTLQGFTNEGFPEFYKRLGFQLVYKKKIYVRTT